MGKALQTFEIFDGAQPTWRAQFADDFVFAALIMRGRAEATRRCGFEFDAFDESVEGEIEIEPRLLAISNHIKSGIELIAHGDADGVVDQFRAVGFTEAVEMFAGKFQPRWKGIAADDSGAKRLLFHFIVVAE